VDPSDRERRVTALIHAVMVASVLLYGAVVAFYRSGVEPEDAPAPPPSLGTLFAALAAISAVQLAGAAAAGRAVLRGRWREPAGRVRAYFLLRAGAAEGVAIYAFALGFLGAPASRVLALFAIGAAALGLCYPGRAAWGRAMRAAEGSRDGGGVSPG
jgi:F0F1-type ATP synthase membrane subunit c/vacuolar-type H+-ATPase subunit K